MQDARDTFYGVVRDRIAGLNAARTVVVRGVTRPGVLVVENELPAASVDGLAVVDCFCLRWAGVTVDAKGALPLVTMRCEIRYATDGSAGSAGMDRGRALSAMDGELAAALGQVPQVMAKVSYVAGVVRTTNVWWGEVEFGAAVAKAERLERVATVAVYSYQEVGEV